VNFLRVKQAQCALADGRLDEAHQLLSRDSVRSHRHGQRLATKLVKAYVKRGEAHLKAGRLPEALADCGKAGSIGGHGPEVAELRLRVVAEMETKRREVDKREVTLGAARQHAREGFLSRGLAMLQQVHGDSAAIEQAQIEMDLHRAKADAAIERGLSALDREDWAAAGHHLAEARRLRPYDARVEALAGRLSKEAVARVRKALDQGRVDTAESLLRVAAPAVGDNLQVRELRDIVADIATASAALEHGDARSAGLILHRVKAQLPGAKWVNEAIGLAEKIVTSRDALAAGPLGRISDGYASAARSANPRPTIPAAGALSDTPIVYDRGGLDAMNGSRDVLPKQFLIQVDGCGAALATCEGTVTIGPVSSKDRPDIGLMADPAAPTVTIRRVQDDYFIRSERAVKVNGKAMNETLLNNGDKVELSPRCLFKFRMPHAASTTAVLELTGTRLVRGDVKRVVLLDKQLVVGAGPACHVRADEAGEPMILCVRDGRLVCQSSQMVKVGAGAYDPQAGVPMDTPVCVGPMTFRVTEA
jgi:hypothetical protein